MLKALQLAQEALSYGEVPVGALVVYEDQIVGQGFNRREMDQNPLGHAEMYALYQASRALKRFRLWGCTLYVTLEPCVMCAGALIQSRLDNVVYGAKDPKGGALHSLYALGIDGKLNHTLQVMGGILEAECQIMLKSFFHHLREAL